MRILAINCGSSSLKFRLADLRDDAEVPEQLAHANIEGIGGREGVRFIEGGPGDGTSLRGIANHRESINYLLDWLASRTSSGYHGIEAVGHRVVHGGDLLKAPTVIDDGIVARLYELRDLAPLHNASSLEAIVAVREKLGRDVPQVATFDTAFHSTMPRRASLYAIPLELAEKYGVRRYGFHGIAHQYMADRYALLSGRRLEQTRIVTLQLGNGCSVAAIEGGRSLDTSMGFTPLEGLVMGTRSGDIDPSVLGFLARKEKASVSDIEDLLNTGSGLKGVAGASGDMREVLQKEKDGDARSALAVEMFCYRARKYIGAYLAALNGAEAVVFGGGIGENSPEIRRRICSGMEWCGLQIDDGRNSSACGIEARISADGARVHAYVIPVDETIAIASDTLRCILRSRKS